MWFTPCVGPWNDAHEDIKESLQNKKDEVQKKADSLWNEEFSDFIYDFIKKSDDSVEKGKCLVWDNDLQELSNILNSMSGKEVVSMFLSLGWDVVYMRKFLNRWNEAIAKKNENKMILEAQRKNIIKEMEKKDDRK